MYLEKLPWLKKSKKINSNGIGTEKNPKKMMKNILTLFFGFFFLVTSGLFLLPEDSPILTSIYKSTLGVAYAAAPGKPLRLLIKRGYQLLFKGIFPLGNRLSIVEKRTPLDIPLDGIRFAVYNTERQYFDFAAIDWIYPSRLVNELGIDKKTAFAKENLGAAFKAVPYFDKYRRPLTTSGTPLEPFLNSAEKLPRWSRKFADGKTRFIIPKDNWLCLRPNVKGQEIRTGKIDRKLEIPTLNPEESLPVSLWAFSILGNWKTGEWNVPLTQNYVSKEYAIAYGIYLSPKQIQVKGKGVQTRFIYKGNLFNNLVCILDKDGRTRIVPVLNDKKELLFWPSQDPSQSIFIPFEYLYKMDDEKNKIFLAGGTHITDMREIKEELQQVRENKKYPVKFDSENLQAYVLDTPRLRELANRLIKNMNRQEAIAKLADYSNVALPYVSDHRGDTKKIGYNGPVEIPYPPTLALMNRGGDCEDHAILFASLFLSSSLPNSSSIALNILSYRVNHEGHVIPMIPLGKNLILDPFPNYVVFNNVPYAYIEATGYGENKLHQTCPSKNGYQPLWAEFVNQFGNYRSVKTLGFNQFQYALADR